MEICKRLNIGSSTFQDYKNKFPELRETLKMGKEEADYLVEDSLFQRAIGYKYDEITKKLKSIYDEEENVMVKELIITKVVTKEV